MPSLAQILAAKSRDYASRVFGYQAIKRVLQRRGRSYHKGRSIAQGNRWGGPHLHQREIARRTRQQARRAA